MDTYGKEVRNSIYRKRKVKFITQEGITLSPYRPLYPNLAQALDYRSNRIRKTNQKYRMSDAGRKGMYCFSVRQILGDRKFYGSDPIVFLGLLREYQLVCDRIQLSEEFAFRMIKYFVRGKPNFLLDLRTCPKNMDTDIYQSNRIRSYSELADYITLGTTMDTEPRKRKG